jgi:DNA-binding response OmpR family regulator
MNDTSRRARVLIADDDEAIRHLIATLLRRSGFDTVEAADGYAAIVCLDREPFDALVVDVMMPRVDGFGVVTHLVDVHDHMLKKTIVVSALPASATGSRLHDVCTVMSKPFDSGELVHAVQQCVIR